MSQKILAIDCEMVETFNRSILARVSIVDQNSTVLLNEYVRPTATVTDYRTAVSGIKRRDIENGKEFSTVQRQVQGLISGCILVGHTLQFDLIALGLSHPQRDTRDLALYEPFKTLNNGDTASLQLLARHYLGRRIQEGEHDSLEDAKAAMAIYLKVADQWERYY